MLLTGHLDVTICQLFTQNIPWFAQFLVSGFLGYICMIISKPGLQLWSEMSDEPLHRPRGSVRQGADGVTLDLLGQLPDHVDLLGLGVALRESPHHGVHPVDALPAGGALPARLVLVEDSSALGQISAQLSPFSFFNC